MQKLAESRNGKCISKEYINSQTKLVWECELGHQWKAKPNNIKSSNSWCPHCNRNKKNAT